MRFFKVTLSALIMISCGGAELDGTFGSGPSDGSGANIAVGSRTSRLSITIANPGGHSTGKPEPGLEGLVEARVTVREVTAHSSSAGWVTINDRPVSVNLLALGDHAVSLGFTNLPPGKITQLRLLVDEDAPSFVTDENGNVYPMDVPSGVESGIKIKGIFDMENCQRLHIPLNLAHKKPIWVHPTGQGRYIFRPVIFAGKGESDPIDCTPTDPNDPNNPTAGDPNNPNDPGSPTAGDPNDPTSGDPNDPTAGDPNDPTSGDPNDPTAGDPNDPNNSPDPIDFPNGDPYAPSDPSDPTATDPNDPTASDPNDPTGGSGTTDPNTGDPVDPTGSGDPASGDPSSDPSLDPANPSGGGQNGDPCLSSADCAAGGYCSEADTCVIDG